MNSGRAGCLLIIKGISARIIEASGCDCSQGAAIANSLREEHMYNGREREYIVFGRPML